MRDAKGEMGKPPKPCARKRRSAEERHRLHDAAELGQLNLVQKYLALGDEVNAKDVIY